MLEVLILVACISIWDPIWVNGATNQTDRKLSHFLAAAFLEF